MSTQLSENTVKAKLADLRKHCRDLLETCEPGVPPTQPQTGVGEDAAPCERRV